MVDVLPLAAFAGVLALSVLWFVGDDGRLGPCCIGNDAACDVVAGRLLDAAERAPTGSPTRWEQDAARALDTLGCRGLDPAPCAVRRYAIGTVAQRSGRFDVARERSCARATTIAAGARARRSIRCCRGPPSRASLERR